MNWNGIKYFPRCNPFAIELGRNSRGMSITELSKECGFACGKFERGNIEPTEDQLKVISDVLKYPIGFFEQYFKTRLRILNLTSMIRYEPIDYYQYKVFRDKNRPIKMAIV